MSPNNSTPQPALRRFGRYLLVAVVVAVAVLAAACGSSGEDTSEQSTDTTTSTSSATAAPTPTADDAATPSPDVEEAQSTPESAAPTGTNGSVTDLVLEEFDSWAEFNDVAGSVLAVTIGDATAATAYGVTDVLDPSPMTPESNFRIGSITKSVTAAVMLQLVDEGLLALDDPVSTHLPEWAAAAEPAGASDVTVRQLLQHTSGFSDYAVDPTFYLKVFSRLDVAIEPEEIVAFSLDQGLLFEPGTDYNYSTTNFVVAGLIIEAVTGSPAHEQFRARVFEPLGLESLHLTPGEFPPDPVVNGYIDVRDREADSDAESLAQLLGAATVVMPEEAVIESADRTLIDILALPQELLTSVAWTGGGIEGSVVDTVQLIPGYFNSGMLSDQSLTELTTPSEHQSRSVGLAIDERSGYTIYSHGGLLPGFRTIAAYIPELDLSITVLSSSMPLDSDVYDLVESVAKLVADNSG